MHATTDYHDPRIHITILIFAWGGLADEIAKFAICTVGALKFLIWISGVGESSLDIVECCIGNWKNDLHS